MTKNIKSDNWDNDSEESEYSQEYQRQNNKSQSNSSVSVYNEKEIEYLDRYLPEVENALDVLI